MNPRVEARLEQVKRTSRGARRACYWLMGFVLLVAAVTAASRLTLPPEAPQAWTCEVNGLRGPCGELEPQAMTVFLVALLGGVALTLMALYRLARLFGNYSRGEIFTRGSAGEIRWIGYLCAAGAVLQLLLFVVALTLSADSRGGWPMELRFDIPFVSILVASLIILLSWVMDVGAELREENELTV
jgi:Protein of unknown function (DUF2975)